MSEGVHYDGGASRLAACFSNYSVCVVVDSRNGHLQCTRRTLSSTHLTQCRSSSWRSVYYLSLSVCLSQCFSVWTPYFSQTCTYKWLSDIRENFTRDASVDEEEVVKFHWNPSACGSGSRNFWSIIQHCGMLHSFHNRCHISGEKIDRIFMKNVITDVGLSLHNQVHIKCWKSSVK